MSVSDEPVQQQSPMPTLEITMTSDPTVPTDDQIVLYLINQRKLRANKKREQMSSLVSNVLPQ